MDEIDDRKEFRLGPGVVLPMGLVEVSFSRAGGPGGQNVNKVSTRCQIRVRVADVPIAPEAQDRLAHLAGRYLTNEGEILIDCESERSQLRNKRECLEKLGELVRKAMVRPKVRRPTKPSKGSIRRRLGEKKHRGEAKKRRRDDGGE